MFLDKHYELLSNLVKTQCIHIVHLIDYSILWVTIQVYPAAASVLPHLDRLSVADVVGVVRLVRWVIGRVIVVVTVHGGVQSVRENKDLGLTVV